MNHTHLRTTDEERTHFITSTTIVPGTPCLHTSTLYPSSIETAVDNMTSSLQSECEDYAHKKADGTSATATRIHKESESSIEHVLQVSAQDMGHRIGNFHNYYTFHPPSIRLQHMGEILDYVRDTSSRKRQRGMEEEKTMSRTPFRYCDLGCNEGDLTIEIATALQGALQQHVEFTGMDIDDELIQRANAKWKNIEDLRGTFKPANIARFYLSAGAVSSMGSYEVAAVGSAQALTSSTRFPSLESFSNLPMTEDELQIGRAHV